MKSFKFIGMALIAIMMGANFASCGSDDEVLSTPTKPEAGIESPKEYIVSLGWKGEIVDITESPLATRGVKNNDVYGIQVYSRPDIDDYSQNYTQYAYGLFDNTGKMTIKLLDGYKYKFIATMVVDGKNKIFSYENENSLINFEYPFYNSNGPTPLTNKFKYSSVEYIDEWNLGRGYAYSAIMNTHIYRPEFDRYYGELTDYKPSENGVANIKMKRTSFGVKVVAEELTEGSLNIRIENSISMLIEHPNTEVQELLSFESCQSAWYDGYPSDDGVGIYVYSENIPISFTWTKEDGVEIPLGTRTIEFKRNKLTTITIRISDKGSENDVGVSYDEAGEMDEGGNVVIDAGGSSDNEVNPEI